MQLIKNTYLSRFFFLIYFGVVLLFVLSTTYTSLLIISQAVLLIVLGLTVIDVLLVFSTKDPITIERSVGERLNLGDKNEVKLEVINTTNQPIGFRIYEGFPASMQERSKAYIGIVTPKKSKIYTYDFTPKARGKYEFGDVFLFISSIFNLVSRRVILPIKQEVQVYPSVLQLKKYELLVFQQQKVNVGIKKIRRLGNNSEFEQIKSYVQGDEIRKINWKATGRTNTLMVNQYQEEKSQNVYCIIDKSRSMQMEFDGLSMLDYAINSTLVLSNITIKNGDKTGLITFSDKMGTQLAADKSIGQMRRIMEELYAQKTRYLEPNYALLYNSLRRTVKTRSLIILFANFETEFAMRRALPILRKIKEKHVLVTVLFQNTDLELLAFKQPTTIRDVYQSAVAEKMTRLKTKIAQELKQNGIHTVLTLPEHLSINTINKYLELKAKGAL
jgi:uncharacterized protein (DUF58 family)